MAKRAASPDTTCDPNSSLSCSAQKQEALKAKALDLFAKADADGNGVIDR